MKPFDHWSKESLEVAGARLYYETIGDPTAAALLFLHGGLGSIEDFNAVLPKLDDAYFVVGLDSRGHGASTLGDPPFTYLRLQHDAEALIHHLHLARVSIFGFSDGGIVAYRLAAARPDLVKKVITVGARWEFPEDSIRKILERVTADKWRSRFSEGVRRYEELNPARDFDRLFKMTQSMWLDPTGSGYPAESVSAIAAPILAARGHEDHLFSFASLVRLTQHAKQVIPFNIPFAGHAALSEQPDMLMQSANRFLAEPRLPKS